MDDEPPRPQPPPPVLNYNAPASADLSWPAYLGRLWGGIAAGAALVLGGIYCTIGAAVSTRSDAAAFVTGCIFVVGTLVTLRIAHLRNSQGRWRGVAPGLWLGVALGILGVGVCFTAIA